MVLFIMVLVCTCVECVMFGMYRNECAHNAHLESESDFFFCRVKVEIPAAPNGYGKWKTNSGIN